MTAGAFTLWAGDSRLNFLLWLLTQKMALHAWSMRIWTRWRILPGRSITFMAAQLSARVDFIPIIWSALYAKYDLMKLPRFMREAELAARLNAMPTGNIEYLDRALQNQSNVWLVDSLTAQAWKDFYPKLFNRSFYLVKEDVYNEPRYGYCITYRIVISLCSYAAGCEPQGSLSTGMHCGGIWQSMRFIRSWCGRTRGSVSGTTVLSMTSTGIIWAIVLLQRPPVF